MAGAGGRRDHRVRPRGRLILPLRRPGETGAPDAAARAGRRTTAGAQADPRAPPTAARSSPTRDRSRQLDIVDDFGCYRNGEHGMIAGSIGRRPTRSSGDPLSARMTHWTEELARDDGPWAGWRVRTETTSEMTATQKHFRLKARIQALGDQLVFAREFHGEEIPRDLN